MHPSHLSRRLGDLIHELPISDYQISNINIFSVPSCKSQAQPSQEEFNESNGLTGGGCEAKQTPTAIVNYPTVYM